MIPTGDTLKEFDRLEREAREVAYSRNEYLQLLFAAAVNLSCSATKPMPQALL